MEYNATTKPPKPSSNISELVSKFAKICKLRSIGVFPAENPLHSSIINASFGEDSSDNTEATECDGEKIHPQTADVSHSFRRNICGDAETLKLFHTLSALKSAHVQLQEAHIPYDPVKIVATDKLVVSQLETLCKIKRAYKEKQLAKSKLDTSSLELLRSEVEVKERLLEILKSENKAKESEIVRLKQQLQDLSFRNAELGKITRRERVERRNARVLDVTLFLNSFKAASKFIHDFSKPLINLMMASGWDLDLVAKSIDDAVAYARRPHKKYAFEAYIAWRMFHGMLPESYSNTKDIMKLDDPIDALMENPNSDFAKFCRKKYLLVVHPMMEMSFFGNLDHRNFISSGKHPRTPFYQIFVKMAKWVWILHRIACSIDPEAKLFIVKRGSKFSHIYMESIVQNREGLVSSDEEQTTQRVELMVLPGFRIGETVVRSQVYLSNIK